MKYDQIIENTLESNKGFIRTKDLVSKGIPTIYLTRYVRKNKLVKLAAGFYAQKSWPNDGYFILQHSFPNFVFSFNSAIYLHGIGDILPSYYEVTGPKNYRPMGEKRDDVISHTDTRKTTYELGIEVVTTVFGNPVKVYDLEKTICDIVRFKNEMDAEVFFKAIHIYAKRKDKNINKLVEYSKIMGIEKKVTSIMEIVLNEN